ncbi:extracellular solute-binding protein [Candidatus Galacturonibacter soehngenii]|uniref:Maltodextrin-binding protein n=1 Tax=Candidatus Galacturonatibacter soehngenii TaxID=2307010 RepID=A0A7V7UFM6_9FIRM|nr:extracellular solute-binding protein [Candidatus Galacturonibacter soehngenii]KAB1437636.1 extracellular solute-binding protein [Candidatus Galacturonibacter soehngenii]MBA4686862.1 extracellular solute-binding protein [Candidatus Galacturonibacter soehngenii]
MKKKIALLLCITMTAMGIIGCGNSEESLATKGGSASKQSVVTIWHDGDDSIMQVIENGVNEALESDGILVKFEKKSGLTDQMKLYGNDEANGPDMYLYAHDSLGTFVEMGILAPLTDVIEESDYSDMLPMTIQAGNYKNTQYLLPVYFETLLFLYNKDLWEGEVPSTTEELFSYMESHTDTASGQYALVNQHSTAYNVAPFINGFGGYIINEQSVPGLNDEKTLEAIEYNKKFAALEADGDYNTVNTLFNEGKAAAIIGGPWLIAGIKEAKINYGIKSLSDFTLPNQNALSPYSGVQAIGIMKYAVENKKEALGKVLKEIANPQIGIELALNSGCAPANQISYDYTEVAKDEMIVAMRRTADTAKPMPNVPEMSVMWGPIESLLAAVNKSGQDTKEAASEYQKQAETAIQDMK